jgi:hypothetical protein
LHIREGDITSSLGSDSFSYGFREVVDDRQVVDILHLEREHNLPVHRLNNLWWSDVRLRPHETFIALCTLTATHIFDFAKQYEATVFHVPVKSLAVWVFGTSLTSLFMRLTICPGTDTGIQFLLNAVATVPIADFEVRLLRYWCWRWSNFLETYVAFRSLTCRAISKKAQQDIRSAFTPMISPALRVSQTSSVSVLPHRVKSPRVEAVIDLFFLRRTAIPRSHFLHDIFNWGVSLA